MLRATINRRFFCAFAIPYNLKPNDHDCVPNKEVKKLSPGEIGIDRLKNMFHDKEGLLSKELQSVITVTFMSFVTGFLIGGALKARNASEIFILENQGTKFQNQLDAQRQLQYKFTMAFLRGGGTIGTKFGMFCLLFSGTSTCLYVYRHKYSISNFIYAGALTGFLFKVNMGLKGAAAGTIVGTVLGTLYGSITHMLLFITGLKMEDVYDNYNSWLRARQKMIKKNAREYMDDETKILKETYEETKKMIESLEEQKEK